jgi:hypothetical protein
MDAAAQAEICSSNHVFASDNLNLAHDLAADHFPA